MNETIYCAGKGAQLLTVEPNRHVICFPKRLMMSKSNICTPENDFIDILGSFINRSGTIDSGSHTQKAFEFS